MSKQPRPPYRVGQRWTNDEGDVFIWDGTHWVHEDVYNEHNGGK